MKHCILVKWNSQIKDKKSLLPEIQAIFDQLLKIDGVNSVKINENVIDRPNRYDLLICIDMNKEVLPVYDASKPHQKWKEKFGKYAENKAIFDYED